MPDTSAEKVTSPDQELTRARARLSGVAQLASKLPITDAEHRGWIARWIVIGFLIAVMIVLGVILAAVKADGIDGKTAISDALDVLKSVLLPVVTLILGYYFGQSTKSG